MKSMYDDHPNRPRNCARNIQAAEEQNEVDDPPLTSTYPSRLVEKFAEGERGVLSMVMSSVLVTVGTCTAG